MDFIRAMLRVFGWLLTPFIAWAASFFGCVAGEVIATRMANPLQGLLLSAVLGAASGLAGIIGWLRILRHSPRLQETLALTEEGVPDAAASFLDRVEDDWSSETRP